MLALKRSRNRRSHNKNCWASYPSLRRQQGCIVLTSGYTSLDEYLRSGRSGIPRRLTSPIFSSGPFKLRISSGRTAHYLGCEITALLFMRMGKVHANFLMRLSTKRIRRKDVWAKAETCKKSAPTGKAVAGLLRTRLAPSPLALLARLPLRRPSSRPVDVFARLAKSISLSKRRLAAGALCSQPVGCCEGSRSIFFFRSGSAREDWLASLASACKKSLTAMALAHSIVWPRDHRSTSRHAKNVPEALLGSRRHLAPAVDNSLVGWPHPSSRHLASPHLASVRAPGFPACKKLF